MHKERPDVVIVKAEKHFFLDMLKKIKTDKDVQEVGSKICVVSATREGHL